MKTLLRLLLIAQCIGTLPISVARASGADALPLSPRIEALFDGTEMPNTERVATIGNRLFVTSGFDLFEVHRNARGRHHKESIAQANLVSPDGQVVPARFLGLASDGQVLYATATAFDAAGTPYVSALFRITLGLRRGEVRAIAQAVFAGHAIPFMPNGVAVDRKGQVYVSNSYSAVTGEAAVLELTIAARPFSFQESDWLAAGEGGAFPNGLQIVRDTLFLASLSNLLSVGIEGDGSSGIVETRYSASSDNFLDDFAVVPGGLVVCEIDNPFAEPSTSTSQLTIITRTGHSPGHPIGAIDLSEFGILPSSVARYRGGPFGLGSLVVTDYLGGGLYTVDF